MLQGETATVSFRMEFDDRARRWLAEHPGDELVIAFEDTRCCGGGHLSDVTVQSRRRGDRQRLVVIGSAEDRRVYMDARIVNRMPEVIPVTVGGWGPLKGLRLNLTGEDWARILYLPYIPTLSG